MRAVKRSKYIHEAVSGNIPSRNLHLYKRGAAGQAAMSSIEWFGTKISSLEGVRIAITSHCQPSSIGLRLKNVRGMKLFWLLAQAWRTPSYSK